MQIPDYKVKPLYQVLFNPPKEKKKKKKEKKVGSL